jgi:hypothetical protein
MTILAFAVLLAIGPLPIALIIYAAIRGALGR